MADSMSMDERFVKDLAELRVELAKPGRRLIGYALVAAIDNGAEVAPSLSLERHSGGLADDALQVGLGEVLEQLES